MDVPNACLHEDLKEVIHMLPSLGLIIIKVMRCANLVIKKPTLYGLNRAIQAWFDDYHSTVLKAGFKYSKLDASMFFQHTSTSVIVHLCSSYLLMIYSLLEIIQAE